MQVRDKPAVHVMMTKETKRMVDEMAADDAPEGQAPDRSRLIGLLIKNEWARRGKAPLPKPAKMKR